MKVLLAEDETKVRRFIKQALEAAAMIVDEVASLPDLLTALKTNRYDILVLDRLLERHDSLDILSVVRKDAPATPILILSALAEVEEKVRGLVEGADDYLSKPFHVSELIARVRSLTRRKDLQGASLKGASWTTGGDLTIDLEKQRVERQNKKIDLTGKEFRLLCLLARHPGRVFSKMELLNQVWDLNHYPESNVVEVTIASLRSKLDKGFTPLLQSRRGVGYWLGEP